jgi:WD40 repeat protein
MKKTFESASSLKDDVRELIPEFYILPEMFLNINNLNLSQDKIDSEGNKIIINNVDLPPWSQNKTTNFVAEMRKNLENSELKINKWIDLIFGNLQRGPGAEENNNIFMAHTYERMVKIDTIEDSDSRNALMRLVEIGVTPFQLFDNESKQKIDKNIMVTKNNIYSYSKDNFLEECSIIHSVSIKSAKFNSINHNIYQNHKVASNKDFKQVIFPKISKIIWLSPNNLRISTNTNYFYNLKLNLTGEIKIEEESNFIEVENNSNKFASSYFISSIKTPVIIYSNNKYMIKGGFWDGRLEINSIINGPKEEPYSTCIFPSCGPIIIMAMPKNEQILICGTKLGVIIAFEVYDKNIQLKQKLFLYNDEITSISINDNLNMFASASKDGYIMLHLLPTCELVRAIKVKLINKKNVGNIFADNIFLSSSPLPVIVIYCSKRRIFKIYSINGLNINEKEEENYSKEITSFCIYNNLDFQEFLIYGTNDGYVKIRQFPDMEIKKTINVFHEEKIETLALSQDKRNCFVSGRDNKIGIINDV